MKGATSRIGVSGRTGFLTCPYPPPSSVILRRILRAQRRENIRVAAVDGLATLAGFAVLLGTVAAYAALATVLCGDTAP